MSHLVQSTGALAVNFWYTLFWSTFFSAFFLSPSTKKFKTSFPRRYLHKFRESARLDVQFCPNSLAAYVLFSVTKDMAFLSPLLVPVPQGQTADNTVCRVIHSHCELYKSAFHSMYIYSKNGRSCQSNLKDHKKTL